LNLTFVLSELLGIAGSSPGKLPTTAAGGCGALLGRKQLMLCAASATMMLFRQQAQVWMPQTASLHVKGISTESKH
jgi:hypothetical protein